MTTPERLRRRQRIESALVVIVIILTCVSTWVTLERANETQDCLEQSVHDLTYALQVRSDLTTQANQLNTDRVDLLSGLIGQVALLVLNPNPNQDVQSQAFRDLLIDYQKNSASIDAEQKVLEETRAKTPLPTYPNGKCN